MNIGAKIKVMGIRKKQPAGSAAKIFAANLRYARSLLRISQLELAERSDVFRTQIGALENARVNVGIETVFRIARSMPVRIAGHVFLMPPSEAQPIILKAIGLILAPPKPQRR